jgi:hypothetical protein
MALKDKIVEVVEEKEVIAPEPIVIPEPGPIQPTTVSPLHDMILAQANERFARDTYFKK